MTLDEAIEILKKFFDQAACTFDATSAFAFRLGIEALERIRDSRKMLKDFGAKVPSDLLPSETKELIT